MTRRPAPAAHSGDMTPAVPARLLPTIALKAANCAAALDISTNSFLALVAEGKMPRPIAVPGHKGLVLYDFEAVRNAWQAMLETGGASQENPWDE